MQTKWEESQVRPFRIKGTNNPYWSTARSFADLPIKLKIDLKNLWCLSKTVNSNSIGSENVTVVLSRCGCWTNVEPWNVGPPLWVHSRWCSLHSVVWKSRSSVTVGITFVLLIWSPALQWGDPSMLPEKASKIIWFQYMRHLKSPKFGNVLGYCRCRWTPSNCTV
jgi:hypothetical protein